MTASYLFSLVFQLPMIAVLIVGLVLLGKHTVRIGRRASMLGRAGLVLLLVATVLQSAWTMSIPLLYQAMDRAAVASIGLLGAFVSVILSLVTTGGIALLITAVLNRGGDPAGPPAPGYTPGYAPPA